MVASPRVAFAAFLRGEARSGAAHFRGRPKQHKGMTMERCSKHTPRRAPRPAVAANRVLRNGAALVLALGLAGCALEVQNTQPAQEYARSVRPPGSVYTGWRVFQDRCAGCHGPDAAGAAGGPDLRPRALAMGPRQFVSLVLLRYEWGLPALPAGPARDALVDEVVQRRAGALTMPAWQGEPTVNAHIADLYAYVSARAQGTQGPGRPAH